MRPGRAAALAGGLAVLGVAAICAGVSRTATARSELMGEFDVYRPAISDLDLLSPSPLDYHTFDYNRPDFATSMDMNVLTGSIGMPSYNFFKQQGGRATQSLSAMVSPLAVRQAAAALKNEDRREVLQNEDRAESARCSGLLHACASWMALKTGKMRIVTYGEGSWCTDDEVLGQACYKEGKQIARDRMFDVPREGEPMSQELWDTVKQSCPLVDGCPLPRGWSTTEENSVYAALPSILLQYQQAQDELGQSCNTCVAQRIGAQQQRQTLWRRQMASRRRRIH